MAEIIAALEGPIAITECIDEVGDCAHERLCPVRSNWHRINEAVLGALQGITLAEMVHPLAPLEALVTLGRRGWTIRSEEHTSELQSHLNLVFRLLLEKKYYKAKSMRSSLTYIHIQ